MDNKQNFCAYILICHCFWHESPLLEPKHEIVSPVINGESKRIAFGDNFNVLFGNNLRQFVGLSASKLGFFWDRKYSKLCSRVMFVCSEIFRNEWGQQNVYAKWRHLYSVTLNLVSVMSNCLCVNEKGVYFSRRLLWVRVKK